MSSVSGGSRLDEGIAEMFSKLWAYIKSTAYLKIYEGYTDDYVAIKMKTVKKFVKIEVAGRQKEAAADEKFIDNKEKAKEAKEKIKEQWERTQLAFTDNMKQEIILLDATYARKYGDKLIDAHKASAAYLKANGKIIGDYKYDMAVINEKMKNAKILGLDEEWQKEQVGELKEKNAEKVAEMQDDKVKAEKAAAEAEEQKETVDAIEKAVPGFAKLPGKMEEVNTAGALIFFTEDEKAKASQERKKAAGSVSKQYDLEEESYKLTEKDEDDNKVAEDKFVKDLSKLVWDKELAEDISKESTPEKKKARIKKGLEAFKEGHIDYIALKKEIDKIKKDTADKIESMGEAERPKGSSVFIDKWGKIDPKKHDEPTELSEEIDEKIKQCEDDTTKPGDILKTASGSSKSNKIKKLKKDIERLKGSKKKAKDKIAELKGEEQETPEDVGFEVDEEKLKQAEEKEEQADNAWKDAPDEPKKKKLELELASIKAFDEMTKIAGTHDSIVKGGDNSDEEIERVEKELKGLESKGGGEKLKKAEEEIATAKEEYDNVKDGDDENAKYQAEVGFKQAQQKKAKLEGDDELYQGLGDDIGELMKKEEKRKKKEGPTEEKKKIEKELSKLFDDKKGLQKKLNDLQAA